MIGLRKAPTLLSVIVTDGQLTTITLLRMKTESKINPLVIILASYLFFYNNCIAQTFNYPQTQKHPVVDTIFGKVVVDEYRWLEDMNSQQVKDWLKAQADYTTNILNKIPERDALIEEYKKLDKVREEDIFNKACGLGAPTTL